MNSTFLGLEHSQERHKVDYIFLNKTSQGFILYFPYTHYNSYFNLLSNWVCMYADRNLKLFSLRETKYKIYEMDPLSTARLPTQATVKKICSLETFTFSIINITI